MANIYEVTDRTFEAEVLKNDRPTVVDFWASWCGPCRLVAPEVEKLAQIYDGVLDVRKMDVDANPLTPNQYHILSIPTVMLFVPGSRPIPAIGYRPADELIEALGINKFVTPPIA